MVASTKKERGVLFCGPMIQALLSGAKTQTRRVVKPQPQVESDNDASWRDGKADLWRNKQQYIRDCCPFGKVGDHLWVRETWRVFGGQEYEYQHCKNAVQYRADENPDHFQAQWRPSIFMPRWASRITLEITAVRVERLQEISEEDAKAEGVEPRTNGVQDTIRGPEPTKSYRTGFVYLWDSIHGKGAWEKSPWVWVYEFRRTEPKASAS